MAKNKKVSAGKAKWHKAKGIVGKMSAFNRRLNERFADKKHCVGYNSDGTECTGKRAPSDVFCKDCRKNMGNQERGEDLSSPTTIYKASNEKPD